MIHWDVKLETARQPQYFSKHHSFLFNLFFNAKFCSIGGGIPPGGGCYGNGGEKAEGQGWAGKLKPYQDPIKDLTTALLQENPDEQVV